MAAQRSHALFPQLTKKLITPLVRHTVSIWTFCAHLSQLQSGQVCSFSASTTNSSRNNMLLPKRETGPFSQISPQTAKNFAEYYDCYCCKREPNLFSDTALLRTALRTILLP